MNQRAHKRVVVDRSIKCRSFRGNDQVLVYNMSATGCMVAKRVGQFSIGETLLLTLLGGLEVAGEVVWRRGFTCGVRFRAHMSERVVSYFGFKAPVSTTRKITGITG